MLEEDYQPATLTLAQATCIFGGRIRTAAMVTVGDGTLPKESDVKMQHAEAGLNNAAEQKCMAPAAKSQKKALIDKLKQPSGRPVREAERRACRHGDEAGGQQWVP